MKLFCILYLTAAICLQDDLQTWTDLSGKFQVDAALISFDGEKVKLRKADGEIIDVKVSRLSAASQKFLESAARFEKDCKRKESQLVLAENIKRFYEKELKNIHTESQKAFIKNRIQELESHAKNKAALIEGQFLTPDEMRKRRLRCNALVDQWESLVAARAASIDGHSKTSKQAQKIIREAQRIEPFIRPDFQLGLENVFITKDFDAAERHFSKCVERVRQYKPLFTQPVDNFNFSSALGNLALLKIRENRAKEAAELWSEVLVLSGATPEFAYNANRVLKANGLGYVDLKPSIIGTFAAWSAKHDSAHADRSLGWLYMPYFLRPKNQPENAQPKSSEYNEAGFLSFPGGTGFVIAPGLLLTNRHVVEIEEGTEVFFDRFRLNAAPSTVSKPVEGKLMAISEQHDLALISFPELKTDCIPIRSDVKAGEEIFIIGYPKTDVLGTTINITSGLISKVGKVSWNDTPVIVTDAISNPGNSGGPIIDEYGNAVGVLTWGTVTLAQNVSVGESGSAAIEFVRQHLPDYNPTPLAKSRKPAEILEKYKPLILRIDVIIAKNRLGELAAGIAQKSKNANGDNRKVFTGLADKACLNCSGSGTFNCPNRLCKRGKVTKYRIRIDPIPGREKFVQKTRVKYYEICPTCSGTAKVTCRACGGDGEEKNRRKPPRVRSPFYQPPVRSPFYQPPR